MKNRESRSMKPRRPWMSYWVVVRALISAAGTCFESMAHQAKAEGDPLADDLAIIARDLSVLDLTKVERLAVHLGVQDLH